jgi:choline dehydrogenase-like flavoprotein
MLLDPVGVSVAQMNVDYGARRSSAAAFLGPAARSKLSNLVVVPRTLCKRVIFHGEKAVGVELINAKPTHPTQHQEQVTVKAKHEIILSAGTFQTPQILLLSGVGPAEDLQIHGIPVVHDSPNVGKNVRDHSAFSIEAVIDPSIAGHNQLLRNPEALQAARQEYEQSRTGPLAVFGASAAMVFARIPELYSSKEFNDLPSVTQAFLFKPERPSTELWLHGGPLFYQGPVANNDSVIAIEGLCQNLLSKGSLTLKSADPRELPLIDPAYCEEPYDWSIVIETIKLQLSLAKTPAMRNIIRKPLHGPGRRDTDGTLTLCDEDDEDAIRKFLKQELTQGFHSMGSCVMGSDNNKDRVVDAQFKVLGIERLRIADMSVCPILTSNHTQINAYLIAERCSQAILGDEGKTGVASPL